MAADDGAPAEGRASWASILGLALLFAAWAAVAGLALLASRAAWASLGTDLASSLALALRTSAAWVALLASLLLLIVAGRGERGRVAAGGVGLLVGVLGLSAAAMGRGPAATGAGAVPWLPSQGLLEWAAVAAAGLGGALLVVAPLVRRHLAVPQHLAVHRHRALHGRRAVARAMRPR